MRYGFGRRTPPLILQSEQAECGLACLAIISGYFGYETDLVHLRARFSVSSRGAALNDMINMAAELHMAGRPLSIELGDLSRLQLPAILHWNFNHFVVLSEVRKKYCVVLDPAFGRRKYSFEQMSEGFTGIAIEFTRTEQFTEKRVISPISFSKLLGDKHAFWRPVLQALGAALVIQLLALTLPLGLQLAIDNAATSMDRDLVGVIALAVGGLIIVQTVCWVARGLILSYLGSLLHYQMIQNLFRHLLRLPMDFYQKRSLADILSRFDSLRNIQRTISQSFLEAFVDGAFSVVTLLILFNYSPGLTGMLMLAVLIYGLIRASCYQQVFQASQEALVRTATYQSHFMETIRGISTVKLFNRQYLREAAWRSLVVRSFSSTQASNNWTAAFSALGTLLTGLMWVALIWIGALAVIDRSMSAGMVFAFAAWQQQFFTRSLLLIEKFFELRLLRLHRSRVNDIAGTAEEDEESIGSMWGAEVKGELELVNVSYQFADNAPYVIRNLNLKIQAGESIAIIGASGEGKTTLMKLMLGLLSPARGEVLVDGLPLKKFGLHQYREAVGVVMQDDALFAGTIADNIAFFDAKPDMKFIEECARNAAIHDDILSFPMGYQTLVGDMGSVFSGGQKQRLLLARALYRKPRILFLDEATSHLDVAREKSVNHAIAKLGITRVIIAHRAETIASASRVVTLSEGGIALDLANTPLGEQRSAA